MLPELRVSQDMEYWGYLSSFGSWGFIPEALFVSNSRLASRGRWISKYAIRRKLCPTISQWESRIRPTVSTTDFEKYEVVRGRVAAGYVHMMINGLRDADALETVREFGQAMPENATSKLLRRAAKKGSWQWKLACKLIRLKERLKALLF